MPPPTFGEIPNILWNFNSEPRKDTTSASDLGSLNHYIGFPRGYAHGTWGYTMLRTAYTPESDALFPIALERLKGQVRYWCHYTRFLSFGPLCEENRVDFDEPNEELLRRFYLEVIEDRDGLAHLDGGNGDGGVDEARFMALGNYFRRWVTAGGRDTGCQPENNPRFCICLVLDSASIASLAALPEELPPLRCAVVIEEKRRFLSTGKGAWVWLLETDYMTDPELRDPDDASGYRGPGWMRMEVSHIQFSWFRRLSRDSATCFDHEEKEQGSGVYWFAET
jgi:hypothetical protein